MWLGGSRRLSQQITKGERRPAWTPEYMRPFDDLFGDGQTKGVNFSLSVTIEMARRMLATACDSDERARAATSLDAALWSLGERESDPARLEEAVTAFRAALEEWPRERAPKGGAVQKAHSITEGAEKFALTAVAR